MNFITNLDSQLIENAREGNLDQVLELLGKGAGLNGKDEYGNTPLICASWNGHMEVVRVFLNEDGVDVNVKGEFDNTALIWASLKGHSEVIRALLSHYGVDVHVENEKVKQLFMWLATV
jgi:ankyrin repeat protein